MAAKAAPHRSRGMLRAKRLHRDLGLKLSWLCATSSLSWLCVSLMYET